MAAPPAKAAGIASGGVLARADRLPGEPGAAAGGRDAVELFRGMGAVLRPDLRLPGGLVAGRPGLALRRGDLAEEALRQRLLQGDAVQRARPCFFAQVAAERGEGVGLAVVGTDDVRPPAPDAEGQRRLEHLAEIVDEGRLVDNGEVARPALGAEGAGRRGHGQNLAARGKGDAEGLDAPAFVHQGLAAGARRKLQLPRPAGAVLDKAPCHLPVVGLVVDVAAATARVHHRVVSLGPGDADAPRLLDHLQPCIVLNPAVLIGEEGGEVWKRVGVGAGHARNMARPGAGSHRTNVRGVQARVSRRVIV